MIYLCVPLVMLFYMWGGQTMKWVRPVGVSLSILGVYLIWHNFPWWLGLFSLIYGGELALGYGENSLFRKIFKDDEKVRDAYGAWCCIPVIISMGFSHNWIAGIGCLLILASYQVREGRLFQIGKFQFLIEDFWRSLAIGVAMSMALY